MVAGGFRLLIPILGVDAPVVPVTTGADRVLWPPRDPDVVGWWSQGAAPGQAEGSAVLVGHAVRNDGGGVFDNVEQLNGGDTIEVKGSDATVTYRVESVEVLSKNGFAQNAERIFAQDVPGRLVVISCEDWDGSTWRSNVITVATPA